MRLCLQFSQFPATFGRRVDLTLIASGLAMKTAKVVGLTVCSSNRN